MNWYVLYVLSYKTDQLLTHLNSIDYIEAFIPQYEYYYRKTKHYEIKQMFNGYIFVKSSLKQIDFNEVLRKMEQKNGLLKQLVKSDTSALTKEEIDMFEKLLDANYIMRMSKAYIHDGKAVVVEGPLKYFEKNIVKVISHEQFCYLDLSFMDRKIRAGLKIINRNEMERME